MVPGRFAFEEAFLHGHAIHHFAHAFKPRNRVMSTLVSGKYICLRAPGCDRVDLPAASQPLVQ